MLKSNRTGVSAGIAVLVVLTGLAYVFIGTGGSSPTATSAAEPPKAPAAPVEFTADGKLKLPVGYREWVYIGTPLTPNDMNDGEAQFPEFHAVYIDPGSFAHFKKTGEFRDGTVIVKDLISVGAKQAPSGKGYFMGEFNGMDVAIKDSKRFKDEPGNWAYFAFGHKGAATLKKEVAMSPSVACNKCHQDNAKTDWVFTQYYLVLRDAAPKKK